MKSFELWRQKKGSFLYDMQEDNESKELEEMARPVVSPSGVMKDAKYPKRKKDVESYVKRGKSHLVGGNLEALHNYFKTKTRAPFYVLTTSVNRQSKRQLTYNTFRYREANLKVTNTSQILKILEKAARIADPILGDGDPIAAKLELEKIKIRVDMTSNPLFWDESDKKNKKYRPNKEIIIVPKKLRSVKKNTKIVTDKTRVYSLYDLSDTMIKVMSDKAYGGDKSGGGGKKYNQGLQCVISAAIEHKIRPSVENAKALSQFVDTGGPTVTEILRTRDVSWMRSASATHEALKAFIKGSMKSYKYYSEDAAFSAEIDQKASQLLNDTGIKYNRDRYNPADIWVVKGSENSILSKVNNCTTIEELNMLLLELFDKKTLIGVSLKKAGSVKGNVKVGSIKVRNHPDDNTGIKYYTFGATQSKVSSSKPFPIKSSHSFPSDQDEGIKIFMNTYGYSYSDKPRASDLSFGLLDRSGGQTGGQIMGKTAIEVCAPYFKIPSTATLRAEFMKGYRNRGQTAFWDKFAKMYSSVPNHPSMSGSEMRKTCLKMYPYQKDAKNPFHPTGPTSNVGHGAAIMFYDLHFLVPFYKLSKEKRSELISKIYASCTSSELGSVHLVIGNEGYTPLTRKGPGAGKVINDDTPTDSPKDAGLESFMEDDPEPTAPTAAPRTKPLEKFSTFTKATEDPLWSTFEELKRDDIKNLKDKKKWKKDLKTLTFDELRKEWLGIGKISKSGTSDEELKAKRDKFS